MAQLKTGRVEHLKTAFLQAINALLRDDRRLAAEREAFKKSHSSGGGNKYQVGGRGDLELLSLA